jgi:hypothetical protein
LEGIGEEKLPAGLRFDMNNSRLMLIINQVLFIGGLTFIRLRRTLGMDNHPWIILLSLIPFWFVIVNNHLPEIKNPTKIPQSIVQVFIQIFILFNIFGVLTIISAVFVKAFIEQESIFYYILALIILSATGFGCIKGILAYRKLIQLDKSVVLSGCIYFGLVLISIFRTSVQRPFLLLFVYQSITILIFALSANYIFSKSNLRFTRYVVYGVIFYLAANVLLLAIGFTNQTENYLRSYDAVMLGLLGFDSIRVYYPLAEGINAFGMVGGSGIGLSLAYVINLIKNQSRNYWLWGLGLFGVAVGIWIALTTDSRGGLLFGFASAVLLLIPTKFLNNIMIWVLLLIQPLFIFTGGGFLQKIRFLTPLMRSGSDALSGRGLIWRSALEYLSNFEWIHIIGYGLFGQSASGVVEGYKHIFESYVNTDVIPLHSFFLQTIFDLGYLGLMASVLFFYFLGRSLIKNLRTEPLDQDMLLAFSLFIYILLIGSVSIIPAFYAREMFFLFIFLWVAVGAKPGRVLGIDKPI